MVAAHKPTPPAPPPRQAGPIIYASHTVKSWFQYYWQKLNLPAHELSRVALTQNRREYIRWTGKRLHSMVLGCYCYLPTSPAPRHLIFIEPDLQPKSIEVTVAHELIHLADRIHGTPRRHRHHGYDSIAADEAAITGYDVEELRQLLHQESSRREGVRRQHRPLRYFYECPNCGKQYPRTRRYARAVSCSHCDKAYNPLYQLLLRA